MANARFASGLSTRTDTAEAVEEATRTLAEGLGGATPDLLLAFASPDHVAELETLPRRLRRATGAKVLLGCTGESIVGGTREVEDEPALALWAVSCPGMAVRSSRIGASLSGEGEIAFDALPSVEKPAESTLLLLADPFSFPMPEFLALLNRQLPGVPAVGGMASGGRGPGQNFLLHGDELVPEGAIVAVIEGGIELHPVVSQGCRPVGRPFVITKLRDNLIQKLGGKPAAGVLAELLQELTPAERELFRRGPFLGIAVDAKKSAFGRGDFLVRGILGIHQGESALAISDTGLRPGQTVQFMLRDALSAGEDLSQLMNERAQELRPSAGGAPELGALLFTCNGRGSRMFGGEPNHDIGRVQQSFGRAIPAAGFFAMGEIGPVGGQNFLHGFTASVALFRSRQG